MKQFRAGPCGYGLHRQLADRGWDGMVRVKTDRRDSLSLARLNRAGELAAVCAPNVHQEALRDLTHSREDMKHLQRQAKQRLSGRLAFLLRHGKRHGGKSNWTQAHWRWLETVKFDNPAKQIVMPEYVDTVIACGKRVAGLEQQIGMAQTSRVWPMTEALMALRGVNLLTAVAVEEA